MPKSKKSTYFFTGSLSDPVAKYYISNLILADGFVLEVMQTSISIWGSTYKNLDQIKLSTINTLDILTAGVSFLVKEPLFFTLEKWIEVKEAIAKKNVIGTIVHPKMLDHHPVHSKKNTCWKKSAILFKYFMQKKGNNNHVLAIKDYRAALADKGGNGFLFAYRSIEDICRAITGEDDVQEHWKEMHKILRTSLTFIKPLKEVADQVRHGNLSHLIVRSAKKKRERLMDISREIIEREFKRTFPAFLR